MSDPSPGEIFVGFMGCAGLATILALIGGGALGLFVMLVKFFWNLI